MARRQVETRENAQSATARQASGRTELGTGRSDAAKREDGKPFILSLPSSLLFRVRGLASRYFLACSSLPLCSRSRLAVLAPRLPVAGSGPSPGLVASSFLFLGSFPCSARRPHFLPLPPRAVHVSLSFFSSFAILLFPLTFLPLPNAFCAALPPRLPFLCPLSLRASFILSPFISPAAGRPTSSNNKKKNNKKNTATKESEEGSAAAPAAATTLHHHHCHRDHHQVQQGQLARCCLDCCVSCLLLDLLADSSAGVRVAAVTKAAGVASPAPASASGTGTGTALLPVSSFGLLPEEHLQQEQDDKNDGDGEGEGKKRSAAAAKSSAIGSDGSHEQVQMQHEHDWDCTCSQCCFLGPLHSSSEKEDEDEDEEDDDGRGTVTMASLSSSAGSSAASTSSSSSSSSSATCTPSLAAPPSLALSLAPPLPSPSGGDAFPASAPPPLSLPALSFPLSLLPATSMTAVMAMSLPPGVATMPTTATSATRVEPHTAPPPPPLAPLPSLFQLPFPCADDGPGGSGGLQLLENGGDEEEDFFGLREQL